MNWNVEVPGPPCTHVVEFDAEYAIIDCGALVLYARVQAHEPDRVVRAFAPGRWLEAWPEASLSEGKAT